MTDTDLLKNTRNTRNTAGLEWGFSLCTADEGDSDTDSEGDASAGSYSSSAPSSDLPVSEELTFVRDLDLGARHDTANFKSNPWTIAKLRAATRKPLPIIPSTGLSGSPSATAGALTSVPGVKARLIHPHLKRCAQPQPISCDKKTSSQKEKLSPRTKRITGSVADPSPRAMRPNPDCLPGVPSICSDSPEIYKPGKSADAILAQPCPSLLEKCNATNPRELEETQPPSLVGHSTRPSFSPPVSISPMKLLEHIDPSLSSVKQTLRSTTRTRASPDRLGFPHCPTDPLFFLPQSSTSNSSYEIPTAGPVKPRSPGALSSNCAGTKRKRSPSPIRPTCSMDNRIPNHLPTARSPVERVIPLKSPVHRRRAAAYDSRVFTSPDEEWSTLIQTKPRTSASKDPTFVMRDPFRIPGLKLPGVGNQASKASWLLTTFQPPPPLKGPNSSTSEATENLKEDSGQIPFEESTNNSSSQTVVERENSNDQQVYLDEFNNPPPPFELI